MPDRGASDLSPDDVLQHLAVQSAGIGSGSFCKTVLRCLRVPRGTLGNQKVKNVTVSDIYRQKLLTIRDASKLIHVMKTLWWDVIISLKHMTNRWSQKMQESDE